MKESIYLKFNRDNSIIVMEDREWNISFLRSILTCMQDLLKSRGYLYFNEIYRMLGITWKPEQENRCFVQDDTNPVEFSIIIGTELAVLIEHKE